MKIAAIDIGSNAARIQISWAKKSNEGIINLKKIEYIRFPLRLGKDVFSEKVISETKIDNFIKLMTVFKLMLELHEIENYVAYATSAMREAENGQDIISKILKETGIHLGIIDGKKEAVLTDYALADFITDDKTYVHIDVGGGSTELNIHHNSIKTASTSFEIGTVRNLSLEDSIWSDISKWIKENLPKNLDMVIAIGTGGNINKISQLNSELLVQGNQLHINALKATRNGLARYEYKERIERFKLNPDRADVIIPASEIYLKIMHLVNAEFIMIPRVGLKDGMLKKLYDDILDKNLD